jgi:hypothetical protein
MFRTQRQKGVRFHKRFTSVDWRNKLSLHFSTIERYEMMKLSNVPLKSVVPESVTTLVNYSCAPFIELGPETPNTQKGIFIKMSEQLFDCR